MFYLIFITMAYSVLTQLHYVSSLATPLPIVKIGNENFFVKAETRSQGTDILNLF